MRYTKKQRQYNLILTTAAFVTIMIAIMIAVGLNKRQQIFYSEAQNFAQHAALYIPQSEIAIGRTIPVMVYAEQSAASDWLGVFPIAGDQQPVSKRYIHDCSLEKQGNARVGYCNLIAPTTPGVYVIRLFRDYLFMTASSRVTVTATMPVVQSAGPAEVCTPQPPCMNQTPACDLPLPPHGWCPVTH